jgi:HK97 family phage prohead protease
MPTTQPDESRELRYAIATLSELQLREPRSADNGSDDLYFDGYAAVFNQTTTLYDGSFVRLHEMIAPEAFDDVLASEPDVHLVIGHNLDMPMARTGIDGTGGLELSADDHGLRVRARLNPRITYVRDLAENMRDGVVDQMSFAFTVAEEDPPVITTNEDGSEDELRVIRKMKKLYDVTVTPQGAYSQTSAALRSLGLLARRAAGTNTEVTPLEGSELVVTHPGGRELEHRHALEEMRRRTRRLTLRSM